MSASPLPEFDRLIRTADPRRRSKAVDQISELFVEGAAAFKPEHVALFDGVLSTLAADAEVAVRAGLAERLAPLAKAPPQLVNRLARDAQISVAGPMLRGSSLVEEAVLIEIARSMSQDHLRAISERAGIAEPVTDILVRRGDRDVIRGVAANDGAQFSQSGYAGLVKRARQDGVLAITVGRRDDLPEPVLQQLLAGSVDLVRRRLFDAASASRKTSIARALVAIADEPAAPRTTPDFSAAQADILALHRAGGLTKDLLLQFARDRKYEQTVALLSAISALPVLAVDKIISDARRDSVLVLGKALSLDWSIIRAILSLRVAAGSAGSAADLEQSRLNFERLSATTAQRIVRFWRQRPPT